MRSTCSSVSSAINTLQAYTRLVRTSQSVRNPRHLSHETSVDGITSTTRVTSCLNNTLVEKARIEEIAVIRELGVWEVVDRPRGEIVFGTRWVDINKGDENKPFYLPQSVGRTGVQTSSWLVIFYSHSTTGGTAKFVDLCNNRRAP